MPKIEDDELLRIRQSPEYRRAVWLARVANLVALPVFAWGILSVVRVAPTPPVPIFLAAWTAGCLAIVPAMVLFHRSGVPFVRKGLSWEIRPPFRNAIMRDVFWPRPR
ncbi:MAG: hypothetical protein IRY92_12900 [Dactylosporangium sp.]|nr:hypothetical protein [Dactylosporangium sp.]